MTPLELNQVTVYYNLKKKKIVDQKKPQVPSGMNKIS